MSAEPRRPEDDVGTLPGIQAKRREALARLGVETLGDLLRLAPRRYEDRRHPRPIDALEDGETALVLGTVASSRAFRTRSGVSILEAVVEDDAGSVEARWFYRGFRPRPLEQGRRVALYGEVARTRTGRVSMKAPELERLPADDAADPGPGVGRIVPIHPRTTGLSAALLRRAVWDALEAAEAVDDPVPPAVRAQAELPPLGAALRALHFPDDLGAAEAARARLAFDELLVHELLLARRRTARQAQNAPVVAFAPKVHERIRARLPFTLTPGQEEAIAEIVADLERPAPMYRLLQGDVGSGKTAVAAYALLGAVADGWQTAFMAPTDVLARQHEATLTAMLDGSRVRIVRLAGRMGAKARREALARIEAGEADIVVGTHAVLGDAVRFRALGLVVVDEQHKFGVRQRRSLVAKGGEGPEGRRPHCLVMTATPIPRTLALTVWGDMDVSVVRGTIPGRTPVETLVVTPDEGRAVMDRVHAALAAGQQAYVIYPLVEESEKLDLKDAQAGRDRWAKALPEHRVGLLHGRLARDAKDEVMASFRAGELDVLVATVVVEVGVDVPNATVLVVEHAERFGLSQLHQLRGRVGRGSAGGLCVLVDRSSGDTPARLEVLAADTDGFAIAEQDLALRGVGDVFGTRQHGRPAFHAASLPRDLPILTRARAAARGLIAADPALAAPEHVGLARAVQQRLRLLASDDRDAAHSAR